MLFDLASYSIWLISALAIGLVIGWRTYSDAPRRYWRDGWIVWAALAFVIGVIVAVLKLLPGRYGLWLEIALLMFAVYILGCFLGGGLKKLVGAHESGGAAAMRDAADSRNRNNAKLEAERQATAKAAADRLAVEVAVKAEADRKEADRKAAAAKAEADRLAAEAAAKAEAERARAEIEQRAAAAAKAEAERLAAATLAKAEAERLAAAAVAKALADRKAIALKAEADRLAVAAAANGSAVKTEPDGPARGRPRQRDRLLPLPGRRRIVLWRKPPQWPRGNEKQVRPPKRRRVVWLQRVSPRSPGETRPLRPTRRRIVWLRRLARPRPIGTPSLHYLRRRTDQT